MPKYNELGDNVNNSTVTTTFKLRDYQQKASDAAVSFFRSNKKSNAIMVLPTGCHAKGSKILMYDGSIKNVEDVTVGDELVGDDGSKRTILELHRGVDKLYEITPIKGEPFIVNGGHILSLYKTNEGRNFPSCMPRIDEISVEEYVKTSNNYKHLHKLRKPSFVDFGNEERPVIEPYFLGLYLGDGCSVNGVDITSQRKEVEDFIYSFAAKYNMKVRKATKPNNLASTYSFSNIKVSRANPNPIIVFLDELGLTGLTSAFKFIPTHYKTASKYDRLKLLAGLLDTDSYYDNNKNAYEYCTKSEQLADDIIFLCRSLGFFCGTKTGKIVNGETYYRMSITGELDMIPTKVQIRKGKPRLQKKSVLVTGFTVKYLGRGNYYGFTIDGNHLYCDGQFFIHHNSGKSLIIADIASRLDGHTLVFQPSKEILEQNFKKLSSYGILDCSIYSASFNSKKISRITFATIGSVKGHPDLFGHFKNVIIDECFTYKQFISTERGKMRIGYIHKLYQDGKELPRVLSYNEKTGKLEPNRILCAKNTGEKRFYKLKFNESFTVKTTLNHPFLTLNGWTEAKDLKIGDAVLSAYPKGSHLQIPNKDQVDFLCGSIVGDGSVDKSRKTINVNRFRFIQGEQQKEYLEWKANMLGCKSKIERIENNGFSKKAAYRFTSPVMYAKDYMCTKKYAIENLNAKSLAVIYMDDGSLSKAQNGATIYSVAESKELTSLFADKLNSFGIDCSARLTTSSSTGRECSYIQIRSEGVKVLCSIIAPFVHKSMSYKLIDEYRQKAGSYDWDNRFGNFGCSVFLGKEYFGKEMAYNIEVEDANTYVVSSARYDKNHKDFDNGLIVHNCHLVNPKEGMYKDFLSILKCKVLGLTATPYRLSSSQGFGSMLKFITRTRPAIFKEVIYHVQISTLLDMGFLAKLDYFPLNPVGWDELNLKVNTTGADYTDKSVVKEYERIDFYSYLVSVVQRLVNNTVTGSKRKGILVFTRFVKEAARLANEIPNCALVTGETPKKEREQILSDFKSGKIKVVANAQVLAVGFDYPELDTIVLARPTMSLALYYQMVGRAIRPHPSKECGWIIDLASNYKRFGDVSDLKLVDGGNGKWAVQSKGRQLTNVIF